MAQAFCNSSIASSAEVILRFNAQILEALVSISQFKS
jgi:hypothetical protein